jgi:pimeloyl-ACP methyl ester carboxylesterase
MTGDLQVLLLHGLGATGDVWRGCAPVLDERWPGRWIAPDLPGHGRSPHLPAYTFESLAAGVAGALAPGTPTVILGHSLGGVVGLTLAGGGFGVDVRGVIGLGIKVEWADDELARARSLAERPVAWFDTRGEAAARYLRVSGLAGLVAPDAPAVDAGLVEEGGRWRLALDARAFGVGAPDMPRLLTTAAAPVLLARGANDPMCTDAQLARLGVPTATLPGLGHNAHVEAPEAVLALLDAPLLP